MTINIAKEYTETPGARYISDGPYSGEDFRDNILESKYKKCIENKEKLVINFDGGYGYSTGFLEECFGGLVRKGYNGDEMLATMIFISDEEPNLIDDIIEYITDAESIKRISIEKGTQKLKKKSI